MLLRLIRLGNRSFRHSAEPIYSSLLESDKEVDSHKLRLKEMAINKLESLTNNNSD